MGIFRDRMERDLQIRGYAPNTQKAYVATVRRFVKYFMRPPDQLTLSDVHRYQLHLTKERRVSFSTFNQAVCALRFFFVVTMETDWGAVPFCGVRMTRTGISNDAVRLGRALRSEKRKTVKEEGITRPSTASNSRWSEAGRRFYRSPFFFLRSSEREARPSISALRTNFVIIPTIL